MRTIVALAFSFWAPLALANTTTCTPNAGTLIVDCTTTVPSLGIKDKPYHTEISSSAGGDGISLHIPANVSASDYDDQNYWYSVSLYNFSDTCNHGADQQLMLSVGQTVPFCNPPALPGDNGYHQTCAFPVEDPGLNLLDMKPAVDGARLHISGGNGTLSVTCDAKFQVGQ